MDRNVVTATVLIALIMVVWLTWLTPPTPTADQPSSLPSDSTLVRPAEPATDDVAVADSSAAPVDSTEFAVVSGDAREITVVTDLYEAVLSTRGAALTSWRLAEYKVANSDKPVQVIDTRQEGALSLVFTSPSSRNYDTRSFHFEADTEVDRIEVSDSSRSVSFRTALADGAMRITYRFTRGSYEVGVTVDFERPESYMTGSGYDVSWNGAVPFSEDDHQDEGSRSGAYASSGGEVEYVSLASEAVGSKSLRGKVDWIAVKSKFFVAAVMPEGDSDGAELEGERFGEPSDSLMRQEFAARLAMPFPDEGSVGLRAYLGPMEYYRIRDYNKGLYDVVDYGWDFFETVTRPLAKFVFIPTFTFLSQWLPNYGWVIIVFSILIKILVHPLTKSSFTSMAKMRELQPQMEAIKEKYADNPQKQQEAMMRLYKETGVNPLGGCLPMLLQYPIIIALWQFLPQAIEIRQQGFLWAADLSAPDAILNLPFTIPLYGNFVAGFTLLMGISMVIQMRLQTQPSSNPQAKIFLYVFPIMIFAIFNKLASGLNLYYLCYNVLTAGHQQLINRKISAEKAASGGDAPKPEGERKASSSKAAAESRKASGSKAPTRRK